MKFNERNLYIQLIVLCSVMIWLITTKEVSEINKIKNLDRESLANLEELVKEGREVFTLENENFSFENGDFYNINRYTYSETISDKHTEKLRIMGNDITIRYINQETGEKITTKDIKELYNTTLMISTDLESYLVSVPATYDINTSYNTLLIKRDLEQPITITQNKEDGYYDLNYSFHQREDIINEFWYMRSSENYYFFNTQNTLDDFLFHDLSQNIRWSLDGYYFPTPYNYVPGGEDRIYRHPSCLAGISIARYGNTDFAKNLGTLMVKTNIANQNELGYWETGPISLWLREDFNIKNNFYDTRFNSDFVIALIELYNKTQDDDYIQAVYRYMDFYFDFAEKNSYYTENGGMYVGDYGGKGDYEKAHTSLNHFLVEMEVIIRLYLVTGNEYYADYARTMFQAIVDTKEDWILEDGNLVYAFYYEKDTNFMIDYVYLTYNDMFNMQNLLTKNFNTRSETLDYLMESKRDWLIRNNAHDYNK
ncbi:MAG: hypothetical protein R3Y29_06100 [bacterium]